MISPSIPQRAIGKMQSIIGKARLLSRAAATLIIKTNVRRWRAVAKNPNPHWDGRNKIIANLVPPGSSVLDLGCGPQTLRRHLDPSCTYQPCDVVQSTPDVILCDFNSGIFPRVSKSYDYVICSGVLEYIRNPAEFLKRNCSLGKVMVMSYNPFNPERGDSKITRLDCDWINHFTKLELEALFDKLGLVWNVKHVAEVCDTIYSKPGETIYTLRISGDTSGTQD